MAAIAIFVPYTKALPWNEGYLYHIGAGCAVCHNRSLDQLSSSDLSTHRMLIESARAASKDQGSPDKRTPPTGALTILRHQARN